MDPQQPTNGTRTKILPAFVPLLVVAVVLLGFVAVVVTLRSPGNNVAASGASLSSCPPTATAKPYINPKDGIPSPARLGPPPSSGTPVIDETAGIPTIKPTNIAANAKVAGCNPRTTRYVHPGTPAYTIADAVAAAVKEETGGLARVVPGSKLTVLRATFMPVSAAEAMLHYTLMLPGNQVLCVVEIGGRFELKVSTSLSGAPPQTRIYGVEYFVFDGHSGNLLSTGDMQREK